MSSEELIVNLRYLNGLPETSQTGEEDRSPRTEAIITNLCAKQYQKKKHKGYIDGVRPTYPFRAGLLSELARGLQDMQSKSFEKIIVSQLLGLVKGLEQRRERRLGEFSNK